MISRYTKQGETQTYRSYICNPRGTCPVVGGISAQWQGRVIRRPHLGNEIECYSTLLPTLLPLSALSQCCTLLAEAGWNVKGKGVPPISFLLWKVHTRAK